MVGKKYQTANRTVLILSESPGGFFVRIVSDDAGTDEDGNPLPSQIGREFVLPIVQLLACYNPVPPEPPTD